MRNSQAWKLWPRWAEVTATITIWSCGASRPTRCTTRAPKMSKRPRASSTMASMDFSVMPG